MKGGPINSARILYFTFHVFLYFCKDFKQLKVFFSSSNFWKRKYLQEKKNSEEAFQLKKLLRQFQKKIRKVRLGELTFDRLFPPKFFFNFQKSFSRCLRNRVQLLMPDRPLCHVKSNGLQCLLAPDSIPKRIQSLRWAYGGRERFMRTCQSKIW